jgi:hypothetical protein
LTGCGTTTIIRTTARGSQSATTETTTPPRELYIGDSATLTGEQNGERIEITLLAYKDAISVGEYDTPESGNRFVAVSVRFKNVGSTPYSDSPSNGATILTTTGEHGKTAIITSGECSEGFNSSVKIAPGEAQQGCIPFEIPLDAKAGKLQMTLASGFGEQTAEWNLGQPGSGSRSRSTAVSSTVRSRSSHCDSNISVGYGTTCPFADNVFKAFTEHIVTEGSTTVQVSSPITHKSYGMTCAVNGGTVECTGGHEALVTFPLRAAEVY